MKAMQITLGFIPLVDAAPLIVAREIGFAQDEGLELELRRAPSWATLRDMLALGQVDAAHMLAPVPVAMAMGLGSGPVPFETLCNLSVNGTVVGVSSDLAARMRAAGHGFDFADARVAGQALLAASEGVLRVGVPFPFSMHAELLFYWLGALGLAGPQDLAIRTVPPPQMAAALARGEIDAFCVGEPWGSSAVERAQGALLIPGRAIWAFAPEKGLAARKGWADADPQRAHRLIRALWRAGRWLDDRRNRPVAAELLARSDYLNESSELLDRALSGQFQIAPWGAQRVCDGFVRFHDGAANFPWRSQASWIATQIAARTGLDRDVARRAAVETVRSDVYRAALRSVTSDLPGASDKLEGAVTAPRPAAGTAGALILQPDMFFDGRIFDPMAQD